MSESNLMRRIQVALSASGARLFRNQSGRYKLEDGRWLASGLCNGASDLIGWTSRTITPDMVGQRVAVFTAVEVKSPGAHTESQRLAEQAAFVAAVNHDGGIAFFANSVDGASALLAIKRPS